MEEGNLLKDFAIDINNYFNIIYNIRRDCGIRVVTHVLKISPIEQGKYTVRTHNIIMKCETQPEMTERYSSIEQSVGEGRK